MIQFVLYYVISNLIKHRQHLITKCLNLVRHSPLGADYSSSGKVHDMFAR